MLKGREKKKHKFLNYIFGLSVYLYSPYTYTNVDFPREEFP